MGNYILSTDLDNDGDEDVIIASIPYCCGPNLIRYGLDGIITCENNEIGNFNHFELYSAKNLDKIANPDNLFDSDFNNDGSTDIVVFGDFAGTILLNYGNGVLHLDSTGTRRFWGAEQLGSPTEGDINGDGWIDIAVSGVHFPYEMPTTSYIAIMNFESNFLNSQGLYYYYFNNTLPNSDIFSTTFADLDGDDDLDLMHCGSSIYITFNKDTITSVLDNFDQPNDFYLYQNFPNPFNGQTQITIDIDKAEMISLKVYNILGKEVRILENKLLTPGKHKVLWDGKDSNGNDLSSGVYFIKTASLSSVQIIKTMLLK